MYKWNRLASCIPPTLHTAYASDTNRMSHYGHPNMSVSTSTLTTDTKTYVSTSLSGEPQVTWHQVGHGGGSPSAQIDERAPEATSLRSNSGSLCESDTDENYVHEEGCSCGDDTSDSDDACESDDASETDADSHDEGRCNDPFCCDPALMYHSEDEVSYYRNRGMAFEDRGDGTGFWYDPGPWMSFGKATGVVFED